MWWGLCKPSSINDRYHCVLDLNVCWACHPSHMFGIWLVRNFFIMVLHSCCFVDSHTNWMEVDSSGTYPVLFDSMPWCLEVLIAEQWGFPPQWNLTVIFSNDQDFGFYTFFVLLLSGGWRLLSVYSICLHSIMSGTFGVMFDVIDHVQFCNSNYLCIVMNLICGINFILVKCILLSVELITNSSEY